MSRTRWYVHFIFFLLHFSVASVHPERIPMACTGTSQCCCCCMCLCGFVCPSSSSLLIPNLIRCNMCAQKYHIFHRFLYMQFQIKRTKFIMRWIQLPSCWSSTIASLKSRFHSANWVRQASLYQKWALEIVQVRAGSCISVTGVL